ncbi:MAG: hypothetical protein ACI9K2_004671, partial [Myxococcota bacterium]
TASAGAERQLALAPAAEAPWADGLPTTLAERLLQLCPTTVLFDAGGNHDLVDAAGTAGITGVSGAPAAAIAALAALTPPPPAPATTEPAKAAPSAPAKPTGPLPSEVLRTLLTDATSDDEALSSAMAAVRRRRTVQRIVEELSPELDDAIVARAAAAATRAWPGERPLPEFTTLLVRAAAVEGEACRGMLTEGDLAERMGGAGIGLLLDVAAPAVAAGWTIDRVLRGATRRERENNPLVEAGADALRALWRAVLVRGDVRGELWAVSSLPAEARAAVPQLLLDARERTVVLPLDADLLDWYGGLSGPEAVGWSGPDAAESIAAALDTWAAPAAE